MQNLTEISLPKPNVSNLDEVIAKGNYLYIMGICGEYDTDWVDAFTDDFGVRTYDHLLTAFTDLPEESVARLFKAHFDKSGVVKVSCEKIEDGYMSVTIYTERELDQDSADSIEWFEV